VTNPISVYDTDENPSQVCTWVISLNSCEPQLFAFELPVVGITIRGSDIVPSQGKIRVACLGSPGVKREWNLSWYNLNVELSATVNLDYKTDIPWIRPQSFSQQLWHGLESRCGVWCDAEYPFPQALVGGMLVGNGTPSYQWAGRPGRIWSQ
jgi:hypothetical protein